MVTKDGHGDHNSEGGEENTVDATLDKLLKKVSDLSAKAIEGFSGPVVGESRENSARSGHENLVVEGGGVEEEAVVDNVEVGAEVVPDLEEENVPGNVEGYVELFDNGPGLSDISGGESNGNKSIDESSDEDEDYVEESSEPDCDESVDEESGVVGGDNSENSDEEGEEDD